MGRQDRLGVARGEAGPRPPVWRWRRRSRRAGTIRPDGAQPAQARPCSDVRRRASRRSLWHPRDPVPLEAAVGTAEPPARGLGTRWRQEGQVEEVPRSSTSCTRIPACSALSRSAPAGGCGATPATARFCTRPASCPVMPLGSPTTKVPTWWATRRRSPAGRLVLGLWTRRRWHASARRYRADAVASAATRAARAWVPGATRWPAWTSDHRGQVAVGADRPPRHQQPRGLGYHGIGVDDPKVHPSDPTLVHVMVPDGTRR